MSKYALAKSAVTEITSQATATNIDPADALEALLITLIQSLKEDRGAAYLRSLLQYEVDMLGSGGVHDLPRGGGHS